MAKHLGILPLYEWKDISESIYSSLKTAKLNDSVHVNNIPGGNLSSKMQDTVECDLSVNSINKNKSTITDIKPDIKDLSYIISNCDTDTINSNISPFIKCDLTNMESVENMSVNMNQDKIKQEITSLSESSCRVKEEIMYCQSCSYSDIDFGKLKFHIFREHPTGAAVVANSCDKASCYLYDIILFCVKETCSFSTSQCDVYEEHLMCCCLLKETLSEDEKERLKSTVKFILNFKNEHSLNAVPGFLDYFSTFNTTFTCKDDKFQINKDLECNSSSMLSGSTFNTTFTCKDDNVQINKDLELEYNLSSILSGPMSALDDSVSCANSGTKFEDSISSFSTPVLLLTTQNTEFSRTVCYTENTSLFEGEQERKHEQISKPDPRNVISSSSEGETALIQSGDDHDVSENIVLEIDVAGSPIDINSVKEETERNKIREVEMSTADCCTKDLLVSNQRSGCVTRMTTETQPIDHASDLYNNVMKKDRRHFHSDLKLNSSDLHCDMKEESGKQSFKISEDVERCGSRMYFIQHKRKYTREKPFKCNDCEKTFSRNGHLIVHMRTHTGEKPFKCNDCGKTFGQKSHLMVHLRIHTEEKLFKFNDCGKNFDYNSNLSKHRRTHTREKPFKCNDCEKTFSRNSNLNMHMRTHTGEKPFKCNNCEKTFSRNSNRNLHMRTHTGEKPFKCNECGKTFDHNSHLIIHKRTHIGEKPFKCNDCEKTFGNNSALSKHRRTHTGEKPYKCNECGKTFGQNSHLNNHRRIHTGEKPYKCNDCGNTFCQNSELIIHMRKHTEEKPFKCNNCEKTFIRNSSLNRHMRTHTGERPFKCNDCEKTFSRNSNLNIHMRSHTGEKPFKCND